MAYNLNDCVELRWGAAEKSDEAVNLQASGIRGAAREDDEVSAVVPRTAPAAACERLEPSVSGGLKRERGDGTAQNV